MEKNKAILVMDMPQNCKNCDLSVPCRENHTGQMCFRCVKAPTMMITKAEADTKPDWCPLREAPQKQTVNCTDTTHHRFAKDGWNHCIDTILKAVAGVKNFVEYKHPNGYSARLYGDSSMCIYFSGKEILHTGSRNVNTETEVMKMLEDYPNLWSSLSNNIDEILAEDEDSEV